MKAGTVIQFQDGRVGTICWRHLDGEGGVWGEHNFSGIEPNFNDDWPAPDFMIREKSVEPLLQASHQRFGGKAVECVGGMDYEILRLPGEKSSRARTNETGGTE